MEAGDLVVFTLDNRRRYGIVISVELAWSQDSLDDTLSVTVLSPSGTIETWYDWMLERVTLD